MNRLAFLRPRSNLRRLHRRAVVLCLITFLGAGLLLMARPLFAQRGRPNEYDVKAAYLYNFARFVEWPPGAIADGDSLFPICILGQDPFGPILDATLAGQTVAGKKAVARRILKPSDTRGCRVVFISSSEEKQLAAILAILDKADILTVSDISQFARRGGMIQFVLDGDRVRFEVNLSNATNAGLMLSSELLKVAVAVRRNPQGGV